MSRKTLCLWLLSLLSLFVAVTAGLHFGTESFSAKQVWAALFSTESAEPFVALIVRNIRLPRVILAGLCGALLAGSGAVFQGFFRNSLADSGIMGISSGAALGAVLSSLLPLGSILLPQFVRANITALCAFLGAIAAVLVICAASRLHSQRGDTNAIILTGTAASAFFSALTSFLILAKDRELQRMFLWTLGSFNGKGWEDFMLVLPVAVISVFLLILCSNFLDILASGNQTATALGLNTTTARRLVLSAGSLAAATAVCIGGTIGFVGLIAPHIARRLHSPLHRILVPLSMIWGAMFLIVADTVSRAIVPPTELPVGIVSALIGSPFFVSLLFSSKGENHAQAD